MKVDGVVTPVGGDALAVKRFRCPETKGSDEVHLVSSTSLAPATMQRSALTC